MDRKMFEEILGSEKNKIFNYLLKILRDREDAEDILQEVFLAFYSKMENVNRKSYVSYLYKTAYHKAINYINKRKKIRQFHNYYEDLENIVKDETEEIDENKNEIVSKCLRKLPEKQAFLIELQFYQKKSYKEIAKILSISQKAVDSRLVRVKRKLKKIISQEMKNETVSKIRMVER